MDKRPKSKTKNYEILRRKHRANLHDSGFRNDFLDMTPKAQSKENRQIGFQENFRFLIIKISTV